MAQEYFPFDAGAGSAITETQWRKMARLFAPTRVESGLTVTNGSGANVNVAAGSCWVDGHFYATDATVAVPFVTNSTASPETVRVVVRLDPTANTITLATTKVALVRNTTGIFELLLAEFQLPPSGTAQTPTGLTDKREGQWSNITLANGLIPQGGSNPIGIRRRDQTVAFRGIGWWPTARTVPGGLLIGTLNADQVAIAELGGMTRMLPSVAWNASSGQATASFVILSSSGDLNAYIPAAVSSSSQWAISVELSYQV